MPADEVNPEECRVVLEVLKERKLIGMCSSKDRDGDTTLHTAVITGDVNRLKVLLDQLPPTLLNGILEMPNKHGKTPLQLAFDTRKWPVLQMILKLRVKNRLCGCLTGIGENLTAHTLLHQAMDKEVCRFLEIYLETISRDPDRMKPDLLVCDETGQTPWSYLMNHCSHQFLEDTLRTLNHHGVDVSELISDKNSQSTMLHLAYRKDCQTCIDLLTNAGVKPEKKDKRGFRADQRNHVANSRPKRRRTKTSHCKRRNYQQMETDDTAHPTRQPMSDFRVVQKKRQHRKKQPPIEEETPQGIVQCPGRHKYHCTYSWNHLEKSSKSEPQAHDLPEDNTYTLVVKQLEPPWNSFNAVCRPRQEQLN